MHLVITGVVIAFALGGCATRYEPPSDIAIQRNAELHDILWHRMAQRDSLRKSLAVEKDPSSANGLRADIAQLNAQIAQVRKEIGFAEGPIESIEHSTSGKTRIIATQSAWSGLSQSERDQMTAAYAVEVRPDAIYAVVLEAQVADQSTPGSSSGSALGAAVGNATYIDRAFRPGGNYSAVSQLTAGLVGAAIGSAGDSAPQTRYRVRYTLRKSDGNVVYQDEVRGDPFRHSPGLCIDVEAMALADQFACGQTSAALRARYLK